MGLLKVPRFRHEKRLRNKGNPDMATEVRVLVQVFSTGPVKLTENAVTTEI